MSRLFALLRAYAETAEAEIYVDLRHLHRALYDFELRRKRQIDEIRIMTRKDVDVRALASRMRRGLAPARRMLDDVKQVWGIKARGEAAS